MKTKLLATTLAACVCGFVAWQAYTPKPAQADEIPEKYRDTVRKGLEYLVKQQRKDGHWEGDDGKHPVAMTGLAALALLMEADRPNSGRLASPKVNHLAEIRKAADWLIACSAKRDGLIFSGHASETSRYMEGHGLATIFLAGACHTETDNDRSRKLRETVVQALKYISKSQSSRGGWYHTSKLEGHDLDALGVTAIQIQALQAAESAGIAIPRDVMADAQEYLLAAIDAWETDNPPRSDRATDTAIALACRFHPSRQGEDKTLQKWWKYCDTHVPSGRDVKLGRDELLHYYYAQAVFESGGGRWPKYRPAMFDLLRAKQNKDGSWPAGDGLSVGSVYSTAVWCTVLQLDHRAHPSRRPDPVIVF